MVNNTPLSLHDSKPRTILRSRWFWISATVILLVAFSLAAAFIIGAVVGETQSYNRFASHQKERIESFLFKYPESYGDLTVKHASNGWAFPLGTVPTQADYDRLAERLLEMFGDELAERMMPAVNVE